MLQLYVLYCVDQNHFEYASKCNTDTCMHEMLYIHVLFEEWERQLGVCMGVLGKSRQGCVGVINNIGALTNLLTSLVLPNPSAYMYIVYRLSFIR